MAEKWLWNDGWEFCKCSLDYMELEDIDECSFEPVDIPHDWLIADTQNLYEDSVGWYRKHFIWNRDPHKKVSLCFEGIYMDATIYVNGCDVGQWKYGYSTFEFDITSFIDDGENWVEVRVVHRSPNSRWYSGAGIYRNVWLKSSPTSYLITDGVYITPRKRGGRWKVETATEIYVESQPVDEIRQRIFSPDGRMVAEEHSMIVYDPGRVGTGVVNQEMQIHDPVLWDIGQGNLYTLHTELLYKKKVIDKEEERFGLRTIEFSPEQGLILNGRHVKIQGVCEHHDLGCLGAAFNKAAMQRKFRLLRSMGVNAIRTSHNMPAPELMDLADEMGFLVDSEAFDMWERSKTTYDYARFFEEWSEKDVESWVRRDRNHPSLLMWSIGNEIYDTHVDEKGQEITRRLKQLVERHDPKRHAPVTIGSNYMWGENAQKCADIVKVAGYNYAERLYEEHHKAHPDWVIYGSETASVLSSRGIYHFPLEQQILTDEDGQCSALGNCTTRWGAKNCEAFLTADRDAAFSLGQFLWTGFDYIGEPTPYQTKSSYFGQLDTAGFPKDAYYICQSQWTDYRVAPMVHIFPYWDFNVGQIVDVRVCSNAPRVELFLNGESKGYCEIDHAHGKDLIGEWKIPYTPGTLKAIAYDEFGNIIAEDERHSFTDAVRLSMKADRTIIKANGRDLIFVEISVKDKKGNPVENARNRVKVEVKGAGRLVGLDNGDSTDYDQYQGVSRRLFNGKLLAVIAAKLEPGRIHIKVSGRGLVSCAQRYEAIKSFHTNGLTAARENTLQKVVAGGIGALEVREDEVVVRKIELSFPDGQVLTPLRPKIHVEADLYPIGASDNLQWRITDAAGNTSNLAEVIETPYETLICAHGDGEFYVRCSVKNKGTITSVMSSMELKATGFGKLPEPEPINGLETIPVTSRDRVYGDTYQETEEGIFGIGNNVSLEFDRIDFGEEGVNSITICGKSTLDNNTIHIRFLNEYGEKVHVAEVEGSIDWSEQTFSFEKVTGVCRVSFIFLPGCSFSFKEFRFENK